MSYEQEIRQKRKIENNIKRQIDTYRENGASLEEANEALEEYKSIKAYGNLEFNSIWKVIGYFSIVTFGIGWFSALITGMILLFISFLMSFIISSKAIDIFDDYFSNIPIFCGIFFGLGALILFSRDYPSMRDAEKQQFASLLQRSEELLEKYGGPDPLDTK